MQHEMTNSHITGNGAALLGERQLLVDSDSGRKPITVARLSDWQYLERSIHRLIAGWGRHFFDWDDKVACHRHIWEQAECVRRIRERLVQFPGNANNLEMPVSAQLEKLANAVLLAPSFEDAVDGIYQVLTGALTKSYLLYAQRAHPIHDAPTIAMLHEIVGIKESQRLWLRDYRRRHPHTIDAEYSASIEKELAACDELSHALPVDETQSAAPVGVNTDFRLLERPAGLLGMGVPRSIMDFLEADFSHSIEARRLFWAYAYMLEMRLAVQQLRWVYNSHFMPWEFQQDLSRHLWDESRHGDSGHSRLLDFGITLETLGYSATDENQTEDRVLTSDALTPQELYEAVFFIGMVAETGHFHVKREAYDDFKNGGDLESAEMMLFDIIDESTHVQYAHKWLPVLAEKAGVDNSDYKERAARQRRELQAETDERAKQPLRREADNPDFKLYEELLQIMRDKQPLSNAATCPPRSSKPM